MPLVKSRSVGEVKVMRLEQVVRTFVDRVRQREDSLRSNARMEEPE